MLDSIHSSVHGATRPAPGGASATPCAARTSRTTGLSRHLREKGEKWEAGNGGDEKMDQSRKPYMAYTTILCDPLLSSIRVKS